VFEDVRSFEWSDPDVVREMIDLLAALPTMHELQLPPDNEFADEYLKYVAELPGWDDGSLERCMQDPAASWRLWRSLLAYFTTWPHPNNRWMRLLAGLALQQRIESLTPDDEHRKFALTGHGFTSPGAPDGGVLAYTVAQAAVTAYMMVGDAPYTTADLQPGYAAQVPQAGGTTHPCYGLVTKAGHPVSPPEESTDEFAPPLLDKALDESRVFVVEGNLGRKQVAEALLRHDDAANVMTADTVRFVSDDKLTIDDLDCSHTFPTIFARHNGRMVMILLLPSGSFTAQNMGGSERFYQNKASLLSRLAGRADVPKHASDNSMLTGMQNSAVAAATLTRHLRVMGRLPADGFPFLYMGQRNVNGTPGAVFTEGEHRACPICCVPARITPPPPAQAPSLSPWAMHIAVYSKCRLHSAWLRIAKEKQVLGWFWASKYLKLHEQPAEAAAAEAAGLPMAPVLCDCTECSPALYPFESLVAVAAAAQGDEEAAASASARAKLAARAEADAAGKKRAAPASEPAARPARPPRNATRKPAADFVNEAEDFEAAADAGADASADAGASSARSAPPAVKRRPAGSPAAGGAGKKKKKTKGVPCPFSDAEAFA
jgi:hypothetical protein